MPDAGAATDRSAAVAALLTGRRGTPVAVEEWRRLEPWAVARARLDGPGGPETVVVKWVRRFHSQTAPDEWRLRSELAALGFLAEDRGVALAPRVLAADLDAGLLILEDLAPRTALDLLLRRDGAAAHADRLAAFARACGELGAATAGQAGAYYARRAALGPVDPAADRMGPFARLREEARRRAAALGAPLADRAAAELAAAHAELAEPGPFLALSNNDAQPNNVLLHAAGPPEARLIDFEFAGFTHALRDAVWLHVPGPAWMSVGDPQGTGLADDYRRALAEGVPEAADDLRYGPGLAAACLDWAIIRLQRLATLDDRPAGHPSRPQLVATLEAAAHTAEAFRALPRLAGWARRVAALLRRRWPDADLDLADPAAFPAFAPRR
ncbi:hypothetical protein [Streptomyces sp. B6B3]|uniref:hypothetical protein n=1 Tax=Streptomyces sp. B6B3 TaxID=3153570 RepID=UPI00325D1555